MVEASIKVYVLQPYERFDLHRHSLRPGWWWSVAVKPHWPDVNLTVRDEAWAPDKDSAWTAGLARLAELKDGVYA